MGANVIDAFSVLFLVIPLIWYALLLNTNFSYVKKASTGLILQGGSEATPSSNLRLNVRSIIIVTAIDVASYVALKSFPAVSISLQFFIPLI